jgi:hypothetical protein
LTSSQHVYEVRPHKDHRVVDLISDVLPFQRLWYGEANAASNAISYANFYSRSRASAIQIARPLQSKIDTQPQLEPALLRLSAMISQYFTGLKPASLLSSHCNDEMI